MSTRWRSICRQEKPHTTDRYHATTDPLSTKNEESHMQCVPRTLRAIASVTWMALSVALIPSSGSLAESSQGKSDSQSQFDSINGVKLHYLVAGKGDPVVLLHGFAETSHMWRPLIAKLFDKHTVIAPDLRGCGQSSAPEGGYTKKAMAQDIHALVKSLKYDRIRLVGHDIGLMVAYAYAAQYPNEVDRLVLMEAVPPGVRRMDYVILP